MVYVDRLQVHALVSRTMALGRALDVAGLAEASRRMRAIAARPHADEMRPGVRVRNTRRALRHWLDGEDGGYIQEALGELLIAALTEPAPTITDGKIVSEKDLNRDQRWQPVRPIVEVKRRPVSAGGK